MKKFWTHLRSYLLEVCVIFTVLVLAFCLAGALIADQARLGLEILGTVYLFLFSLYLAAANLLFRCRKPHIALRVLFHFVLVAGVVLFAFAKLTTVEISFPTVLLILAALAVIYLIGCVIAAVIAARKKRREESDTDYRPMFGKNGSASRASKKD